MKKNKKAQVKRMGLPSTHEGGKMYHHSLDHCVEFFSKAGSLLEKRDSFYGEKSDEPALSLFQKAWIADQITSFKLLLWLRDCRGGAGNRSASREIYSWLADTDPEWIKVNIGWLPLVGRWDDLRSLFGTMLEEVGSKLWKEAISKNDVLAAKWADRKDKPLQKLLETNEAGLRKLLSKIRKEHIVEFKMCSDKWGDINYEHVPSVAMARYTKAFGRHDEERFNGYKESLKKGEAKINADVLFPHDCVRTVRSGDKAIGNAQFDALPNYMATDMKVIVIADTSGSMSCRVAGSICASDVSQGMALYCSSKIPKDNPFYKKFLGFSTEGKLKDWSKMSFSEAVGNDHIFDGAVGSTRIDRALDTILKSAQFWKLDQDKMPNMLIIVSDMQFHQGTEALWDYESRKPSKLDPKSEVEKALDRWVEAGYKIPTIVYWNTAGYAGQPQTSKHNNIALVSGFSPSILKAIFACEDFTPKGVMLKALEKYKIEVPK